VPFWAALNAPVLTVNGAILEPPATVTEAGALSADNPLRLSDTTAPPDGAPDSVTVQLLLVLDPNVVGLHCSDETTIVATRFRFILFDVPL